MGRIKGDTRSLDYSSSGVGEVNICLAAPMCGAVTAFNTR